MRNELDRELISKYLPELLDDMFNKLVEGPNNNFKMPPWLLQTIKEVVGTVVPPPKAPSIRFMTDDKSLAHNAKLLEWFNYNIAELFNHFVDTMIGNGSEFQPPNNYTRSLAATLTLASSETH
jgi:hypothetical protein